MLSQTRLFLILSASVSLVGCETTDISKAGPATADTSTGTDVSSGSSTTITNYTTVTAISTVTETETEIHTQTQTATVTATATVIVPTTVTSTATVTASSVQTVTATATKTVTATATAAPTATVTSTVTNTATQTVPSTVTATVTNSSTRTVTATQTINNTATVTVTATATDTGTDGVPSYGSFSSSECFLNKPASDGFARKIYTRASLTLEKNGKGSDYSILYDDAGCEKEVLQFTVEISFRLLKREGGLYLIYVTQYNDPKNKKDVTRYWIPALPKKNGWLLDIDYARGAPGPFLVEPCAEDLKEILANIEKRGLLFEKK